MPPRREDDGVAMSVFSGPQGRGAMRAHREGKRDQAQVRQLSPGARSVTQLALELGVPATTVVAHVDEVDGWTVDERVAAPVVAELRAQFGGAA